MTSNLAEFLKTSKQTLKHSHKNLNAGNTTCLSVLSFCESTDMSRSVLGSSGASRSTSSSSSLALASAASSGEVSEVVEVVGLVERREAAEAWAATTLEVAAARNFLMTSSMEGTLEDWATFLHG
jgi:hypothetical protein